jgi:hypothetical protein
VQIGDSACRLCLRELPRSVEDLFARTIATHPVIEPGSIGRQLDALPSARCAGVNPKIVSERLGHASIVLTLDTYSHVLPDMQDEVVAKLDILKLGRPVPKRF